MMKCLLTENKLPIVLSPEISKQIEAIEISNQNNKAALSQWYEYVEGIKNYISNRAIAFDYANRYTTFPNGARFIGDFGWNVGYTIKQGKNMYGVYVYVFMINLSPEKFGLNENKHPNCLLETYLYGIIKDIVYGVIKEHKNLQTNESFSRRKSLSLVEARFKRIIRNMAMEEVAKYYR